MLPLVSFVRTLLQIPVQSLSEGERKLAQILKISANELPTMRLGGRYYYRPFAVPKQDGRGRIYAQRHILAPSPALKELQRRLLRRYLAYLPVHPAAMAFHRGASIAVNARRHAGSAVIATTDLADFFESTSARRVREFFIRQGWRAEALAALMRLCVYNNGLPQGAPTSPCLSNLVNADLDAALDALARRAGAVYTRYGDDLTFSWKINDNVPSFFQAAVRRELLAAGYQIQPRKGWQVWRAADEPEIAGVVLGHDGSIHSPARVRREVQRLRWRLWWKRSDKAAQARLNGYNGFLHMLNPK